MQLNKYINGPINAVRLEGTIFGIKKILYVFMDYHIGVSNQTQCESWISEDFTVFLAKEFSHIDPDRSIDFFFETGETLLNINFGPNRLKYIAETSKFFNKMIRIDKNKKNVGTEFGKNVRFHYIDIRDYFSKKLDDISNNTGGIIDKIRLDNLLNMADVKILLEFSEDTSKEIIFIKKLMTGEEIENTSSETDDKVVKDRMIYLMKKLQNKYAHKETKEKINPLVDDIINKLDNILTKIIDFRKTLDEYIKYYKNYLKDDDFYMKLNITKTNDLTYGVDSGYTTEIIARLTILYSDMELLILSTFAKIVDLYFLRRFIDKDYVHTAVSYTGIAHSIIYIHTLVKYFNMVITNASYLKDSTDKVNRELKNHTNVTTEVKLLFYPPKMVQCTDLTHFPDSFE